LARYDALRQRKTRKQTPAR